MSNGHPTTKMRRVANIDTTIPPSSGLEHEIREYVAQKVDEEYDGIDGDELLISSVNIEDGGWYVTGKVVSNE